jgi:hypothetical protein
MSTRQRSAVRIPMEIKAALTGKEARSNQLSQVRKFQPRNPKGIPPNLVKVRRIQAQNLSRQYNNLKTCQRRLLQITLHRS